MRNILITGGSGFLGRGLVEELITRRHVERVCIYSRGEWAQAQMAQQSTDWRLRFFIGDVRDAARLERAMHGVDTVIHAAALKRIEVGAYNPTEMAYTNVQGTANALMAAERCLVRRFVLVSSDKAYAPANAYGASKFLAECIVLGDAQMRGLRRPSVVACRYGNVAGSTGSVIPIWRRCLEQDTEAQITHPDATRFWMTRDQAVRLVLDAAAGDTMGEVVIPDLPAFRLGDLAEAMGVRTRVIGLQPGEKMHESMDALRCSKDARRMSVEELREALKRV